MRLTLRSILKTIALSLLAVIAFAAITSAQTISVFYNFCSQSNCTDGSSPYASVIADSSGNLYGTTSAGGAYGQGTLFKINSAGHETVLYSFCVQTNCTDGSQPMGDLTRDSAGNFYGTTAYGGTQDSGTVFKLSHTGQETVLYNFCSTTACADGKTPEAGLILDSRGNLYGTTAAGGSANDGVVFKLTSSGQESTLYSFCSQANCVDGAFPEGDLVLQGGNLYGLAYSGGALGWGVVFEFAFGREMVLYNFNYTDGAFPQTGLSMDQNNGNIYVTVGHGGLGVVHDCGYNGCGTLIKLDSANQLTLLHDFCSVSSMYICQDGRYPLSTLYIDQQGNLFGTTGGGGITTDCGTVFEYTAQGALTTTSFSCTNGDAPLGRLVSVKGNLYGVTEVGGSNNSGVVFKFIP